MRYLLVREIAHSLGHWIEAVVVVFAEVISEANKKCSLVLAKDLKVWSN